MSDTGIPTAMIGDITSHAISSVATLIRPYVLCTPVAVLDRAVFGLEPGPLVLKLEQLQHSGSFKARGAFANLLLRPLPRRGWWPRRAAITARRWRMQPRRWACPPAIFVPEVSSPAKIERIRGYGADLVVGGAAYADALAASEEWVAASGALPVPAFDQVETILGRRARWAPNCGSRRRRPGTVLASVGGGGLLAGICAAYAGQARVVGVEPEGAPTLTRALRAGQPVDAEAGSVAIDSLAPRRVGEHTFAVIREHVAAGRAGQ